MKFLTVAFWKALALKYGVYALAFNAFIEAIFFPIPPDVLLITLCLTNPENSFLYAIVATLFSSLGGVVGYYVGYFGGKPLAERFFGEEKVKKVHRLYESYESVIILLAGFSPLPYKLFTVTSGVLFASLKKLFIFSLIGRGSRFFAEGALIYFFGEDVKNFALRNLNLISLIIGLLILVSFIIYRRYRKGVLP
ncbi:membrane protein YqaA, SNARE-associated domain [Balnearium lithotrophicum]|uniref:Membrane protein YqaA, SNARE-associated domain n=1 Tax=Balnearium lithotrophicum TaxID=223788 RepID=A0A521D8J0_9BACT|nr:VTT domain-containing protein [Balnearium lithotrophicum]SMO68018.1 membrane protein YqaA, SNARE-associated domain [Balnearium lithotrophicum]